jgi:CRP/FNR family transcriptional regulator
VDLEEFLPFRNLTKAGRDLLYQGVLHKEYAPATTVLRKGDRVSGAYIVTSGSLRVFSIAPSGAEATLYSIDPGETCVLALNCLFSDLLYPAWVESRYQTTVAIVPGSVFRKLFETEPSIQDLTVHALSTLVFRLMNELEQVHFYKIEHRLANLILLRASSDGLLRMTQQEMACHLGTTREVVAKIMRELVARRLVETRRGLTIIKNVEGLTNLMTPGMEVQA